MTILDAAAAPQSPLYIHPQTPQCCVQKAYYHGLGNEIDIGFATSDRASSGMLSERCLRRAIDLVSAARRCADIRR